MAPTPYRQPARRAGQFTVARLDLRDARAAARTIGRFIVGAAVLVAWMWLIATYTPLEPAAPPRVWYDAAAAAATSPFVLASVVAFPAAVAMHELTHATVLGWYLGPERTVHVRLFQFDADGPHSAVAHFRWMDERLPLHAPALVGLAPLWLLGAGATVAHYAAPSGVLGGVAVALVISGLPSMADLRMVRHAVYQWHADGYEQAARRRHAAVHG